MRHYTSLWIFYAHSIEGKPLDDWHRLEDHLKGTAELASSFAARNSDAGNGDE